MLKPLSGFIGIIFITSLLSGCLFGREGYIHDRQQDYLQSKSDPTLKIPNTFASVAVQPALPIPPGQDFSEPVQPSLAPPDVNAPKMIAEQTAAQKQALAPVTSKLGLGATGFPVLNLPSSYAVSWLKMQTALTKLNYQLIGSDKKTGVIEVMSPVQKGTTSDIYQFNVTQGAHGTIVAVTDQTGNEIPAAVSRSILTNLKTQLGN